jgi:hypothetical protein
METLLRVYSQTFKSTPFYPTSPHFSSLPLVHCIFAIIIITNVGIMTTKYRNAAAVAEERILELTAQFSKTVDRTEQKEQQEQIPGKTASSKSTGSVAHASCLKKAQISQTNGDATSRDKT